MPDWIVQYSETLANSYAAALRTRYNAQGLIGLAEHRQQTGVYGFSSAYGLSSKNGWACGGLGGFGTETNVLRWPLVAPLGDYGAGKIASDVKCPTLPARALSINSSGDCVGMYSSADVPLPKVRAFVKRSGEPSPIDLNAILGTDRSGATYVNDHGVVVGTAGNDGNTLQAFCWDSGSQNVQMLGYLPGHSTSTATCINNSGTIVGVSSGQSGNWRAFISRGQGLEDLGQRVFGGGVVINSLGVVAATVFFDDQVPHAAILDTNKTPWSWVNIDTGPHAYRGSYVGGINDAGQVVGYWPSASINDPDIAFLYEGRQMRDLNLYEMNWPLSPNTGGILIGGYLTRALAIDNVGRILASYDGEAQALLSPIERRLPGDLLLTYLGFLGGITAGGGGTGILPSGPVPIDPPLPLTREERDLFIALAVRELAKRSAGGARDHLLAAAHEALEHAIVAILSSDEAKDSRTT